MLRDDDAIQIFVEESQEHLADIEGDLLVIEKDGSAIDDDLINKVFRAVHTVKGGAGFLGYETIKNLAHKMENVMGMIRSRELKPNSAIVSVLLHSADTLQDLIHNLDSSNEQDISKHLKDLIAIAGNNFKQTGQALNKEKKAVPASTATKDTPSDNDVVESVRPSLEIQRDKEAVEIFVEESEEHLADVESDLLAIEKGGSLTDDDLVNKVFRAVHTVKGGAGFLGYENIKNLAHKLENVMGLIRSDQLKPDSVIISVFLAAVDSLQSLIANLDNSDEINVTKHLQSLARIEKDCVDSLEPPVENDDKEQHEEIVIPLKKPKPAKNPAAVDSQQNSSSPDVEEKINKNNEISRGKIKFDSSLRVNVKLLDQLMNLAGELVLSRNQLVQAVASKNMASIELVKQRIDVITSDLQESIMFTRMQPIGKVFNRFPRLVREMTLSLGKEIELSLEGEDVELDKTILEAISGPLTHLIRNSIDHGIEMPQDRKHAQKPKKGLLILRAKHEAGMVILEVIDDGRGMSPDKIVASILSKGILTEDQIQHLSDKEKLHLIFLPGFSTATSVTDISGRGVGMDVVKTNLDKLGGQVDIFSKPGKGTTIRIKLPLTLAIISAQIVICGKERYSIPQVNLEELLRVPANEIKDRVEVIGRSPVLKLRGNLLPLVKLVDILGAQPVYGDFQTKETRIDRRQNIADRRSLKIDYNEQGQPLETRNYREINCNRKQNDRRYRKCSALHIAIVNTGNLEYGLVVDALKDVEEIVVKPLGRHLRSSSKYSGATIMGDGIVSLILDVGNIAREAGLISFENSDRSRQLAVEMDAATRKLQDLQSFLLFRNGDTQQFGVPLNLVLRVIKIKFVEIEYVSGKRVLQYRGESLPLFSIDEVANVSPLPDLPELLVIIFLVSGREVGLLATKPVNALEMILSIDDKAHLDPGIMGSVIIDKKITLLVNIYEVVKILKPNWFSSRMEFSQSRDKYTILIAEDSVFFQGQITKTLQEEGFHTILAEDGQLAWEKLVEHGKRISLLVTDIEMPRLNGFQLSEKIRDNVQFADLPIIAITTLAGEKDYQRGKRAGVNKYLVKFDRDLLVENVLNVLGIQA